MSPTTASNVTSFIRALIKSPALWIGLGLYSIYWVMSVILPIEPLLQASSVLVLVGGMAIFLTWLPAFIVGVASGARIGSWQLPVAIVLTWLGSNEKFIWALVWRFTNQPDWMNNHHFIGQANWIVFLSSFLYIISPGNDVGKVPVKNWFVLVTAVGFAMFMAGAVITALILRPGTV